MKLATGAVLLGFRVVCLLACRQGLALYSALWFGSCSASLASLIVVGVRRRSRRCGWARCRGLASGAASGYGVRLARNRGLASCTASGYGVWFGVGLGVKVRRGTALVWRRAQRWDTALVVVARSGLARCQGLASCAASVYVTGSASGLALGCSSLCSSLLGVRVGV